jgi:hypothetical protein
MNVKAYFFSIKQIFMILAGMRNYTEQILVASDVQKLIGCLNLNNYHTEFFDRHKDNDGTASDVAINVECVKELINIYMEVYISLMKLYMENSEKNINHFSTDVKLRILIDILTFSHGKFSFISSIL